MEPLFALRVLLRSWMLPPAGPIVLALLVTSAMHMRRAVRAFEGTRLEVVPAPVPEPPPSYDGFADWLPSPGALQRSAAALHELLGLIAPRSIR